MSEEIVIRPPSEAHSIVILATRGCSHNNCTFCGVYKNSRFAIRPEEDLDRQIHLADPSLLVPQHLRTL